MARSRRQWPVNRTTARLIVSAVAAGTLAARVPALRGGLFLLAAAAVTVGYAIFAIRRQPRRPSN